MFSIIRGFLALILSLALIIFAVINRQLVPITLSPLAEPLNIPLYMIALGLMGIGFIIGALSVWSNDAHIRRDRRRQRKTIKQLEKDLKSLKHNHITDADALVADFFPSMPADKKAAQK